VQGLHITLLASLFDLSAVLWANIAGTQVIPQASDLDRFTMAHVAPESSILIVHLFSVAYKTVVVLVLMYRLSLWVSRVQDRVAAERLARPEGRTVFLSDVPGGASAGAPSAVVHRLSASESFALCSWQRHGSASSRRLRDVGGGGGPAPERRAGC